MSKRFAKSHPSRALQIWQILISAAHNHQILTYGMLAKMIGYGGAGVFAQILGHIAYYCKQNALPPLTALVVTKKKGRPGSGIPIADPAKQLERVFGYNWFQEAPPTVEEFRIAYKIGSK